MTGPSSDGYGALHERLFVAILNGRVIVTSPRVSVVMPVYNAMPYLKEAVASLLTQTFEEMEIIALDDASTDGSGEFLDSIGDPRMRVVHCEKQGLTRLLNKGLGLARGEYYARMDADDISLPSRIEKQVAFMDQNLEVAVCGSQAVTIDGAGNELGKWECPQTHSGIFAALITTDCPIIHPAAMIRRQPLYDVGGYRCSRETAEDFDLWWRLSMRARLANHAGVLLKYRRHGGNVTVVRRDIQGRLTRQTMIDHLLANGLVSSVDEGDAYIRFVSDRGPERPLTGRPEVLAFRAVVQRLSRLVASSLPLTDEDILEGRRSLRWTLIARALRCSRLSLERYKLLWLSLQLFPESRRFPGIVQRLGKRLFRPGGKK
jgi:glycosyltransferase involved in cell wall biosynthesis